MNVVILQCTTPGFEKPFAVMHCGVERIRWSFRLDVKCYRQLESFATREEAIDWCLENGHTIVIDAIAEAEE